MILALKIIGIAIVFVGAAFSFSAKKFLCKLKKRDVTDKEVVSFKSYMLLMVIIGTIIAIVPEYMSTR